MKEILIATKNKGKVIEFDALLNRYGIHVYSLDDLPNDTPDIKETGITFEENAQIKAEHISKRFNKTVIADDSGLIIDALNGQPGVYSARYAGEPRSDKRNNDKVLYEMQDVNESARTARFVSVLALAMPGKYTIFKKGYCEGSIAFKPSGSNGFGYDPIFIPRQYALTMAELSNKDKNRISHRYHALKQLEEWLMDGYMND